MSLFYMTNKQDKLRKTLIGVVVLFVILIFSLLGSISDYSDDSNNSRKSEIYNLNELSATDLSLVKAGIKYELDEYWQSMDAEPICYEYLIDGNWLRLRCDPYLTKAGMQLTLERIRDNIAQKTSKKIRIDIAFKDNDYKTLEIFQMDVN